MPRTSTCDFCIRNSINCRAIMRMKRGRDCITAREARQDLKKIKKALFSVDAAIGVIILEEWAEELEQIIETRR